MKSALGGGIILRFLIVAAASLLALSVAEAKEFKVILKAGEGIVVPFHSTIVSSGCAQGGAVSGEIKLAPGHGKAWFQYETVKDEEGKCKGNTFRSNVFHYTPAKGYKGEDHLTFRVGFFHDTSERRQVFRDYDIYVRIE